MFKKRVPGNRTDKGVARYSLHLSTNYAFGSVIR
jgi:hypothetical protein